MIGRKFKCLRNGVIFEIFDYSHNHDWYHGYHDLMAWNIEGSDSVGHNFEGNVFSGDKKGWWLSSRIGNEFSVFDEKYFIEIIDTFWDTGEFNEIKKKSLTRKK